MGLIGNILGLQGKGRIDVVVDRPYYMSGEVVKGKIVVEVTSPIQCNEVVLLASGKEKVEWKDNGTTHTGVVEFFKKKIVLYCVERTLQPGSYEFAFDYQLPENLPGSFDAKKESAGVVAKIEYSMTGTVIVDGVFARDLMKKAVLVLYTSHVGQLVQPSVDTCSRKVTYLCFDRGTCAFKAAADKTLYDTTDTPKIHIDIQNGSSENVVRIQCRLVRRDVLTASDGATKTCHTDLCDASFPGVPAHAVVAQDLPFALTTKDLNPSTKGTHLVVTYVIHVLCDLPRTSADILLALPIEITTPMLRPAFPSTPSSSTQPSAPTLSPKHVIAIPTDGTTAQPPIVIATDGTLNDQPAGTPPTPQEPAIPVTPRAKRASVAIVQPAPQPQPPPQSPPAVAPALYPGQMQQPIQQPLQQPMQPVQYSQPMQPTQFGLQGQGGLIYPSVMPPTTNQMMSIPGQTMHMVMAHPSAMVNLPGFMAQPQLSPMHQHQPVAMWPPPNGANLDTVSVDGGGPADVLFVNCTPMPIDILWVDTVGVESFYARVNPSESYMQPTFTNHLWKIGQCGQIILGYRVRVGRQRVEVLGPGLANYY